MRARQRRFHYEVGEAGRVHYCLARLVMDWAYEAEQKAPRDAHLYVSYTQNQFFSSSRSTKYIYKLDFTPYIRSAFVIKNKQVIDFFPSLVIRICVTFQNVYWLRGVYIKFVSGHKRLRKMSWSRTTKEGAKYLNKLYINNKWFKMTWNDCI